jgi:hypothetical protein
MPLLVMIGSLLSAPMASAQSAGSIAGVVRDTTGLVLPGVTVEAASPALIEKVRTVVTDDQGQYRILDLRPGVYTMTFTLSGFSIVKREAFDLTTGVTATVNAEMGVGAIEETVLVSGASPVVDVQNVNTQKVLSRETLDTLPTGKSLTGWSSLTLGVSIAGAGHDVGGNRGETSGSLSIHGGRNIDMQVLVDGMNVNTAAAKGGGFSFLVFPNHMSIQEVTLESSNMSAENETAGIQVNLVPKDGGNAFAGSFVAAYTGKNLQSSNLTDVLRARGLSTPTFVKAIWDYGAGLGGPVKRNKLWFFTAQRWWGAQEYAPGNYFNRTQGTLFYNPDLGRPAYQDAHNRDTNGRLTWQVTEKHKLSVGGNYHSNCLCYFQVDASRAPEASINPTREPRLTQVTWTYPATNRLLLQSGFTYSINAQSLVRSDGVSADAMPITELSTGYAYGAAASGYGDPGLQSGFDLYNQTNSRFSVSYATGTHAFNVGLTVFSGTNNRSATTQNHASSYAFRKPAVDAAPVPVSVTYYSNPTYARSAADKLALYAQDQWKLSNLTLNLGIRFESLHGWNPAQSKPAGKWVPALNFAKLDDVPDWKDVAPRLGASYDLFGNGKTAIKAAIGRYVQGELMSVAVATNASNAIVQQATRTWTDDGDYVPQESELGPLSNTAFGTVVVNTQYADDVLKGWGVRPYNWTATASLQHELRSGVGLTANYFRRWYGNFMATDNLRVTPLDYEPYCLTAPVDPRLPGGGGNQLCGLYDITPTAFGAVQNLVTRASYFGKQTEVYNGLDVSINARFRRGGLIGGGVSSGQTVTDNCFTVDSPQQERPGFCHVTNPFKGQTQLKLSGAYQLPWDLHVSGVFQNLAGVPVTGVPGGQGQIFGEPIEGGSYVASNGSIAPSLGRNLGACGGRVPCTATATVNLVAPYSAFENRLTQLDLRLSKVIPIRGVRVRGTFDAYNVFNANTILQTVTRVGPSYLQPTRILAGRLFKFGAQVDF